MNLPACDACSSASLDMHRLLVPISWGLANPMTLQVIISASADLQLALFSKGFLILICTGQPPRSLTVTDIDLGY